MQEGSHGDGKTMAVVRWVGLGWNQFCSKVVIDCLLVLKKFRVAKCDCVHCAWPVIDQWVGVR